MALKGRNFLSTQDFTRKEIEQILATAALQKKKGWKPLKSKPKLALLFFNPSLRTRSSFELAAWQLGGHAVTLQPGKDAWAMEWREGIAMDGEAEEVVPSSECRERKEEDFHDGEHGGYGDHASHGSTPCSP